MPDASNPFSGLSQQVLEGRPINREQAMAVLMARDSDIFQVFREADAVRRHFFGDKVRFCSIMNIKSGNCGEDCAFCAQSGRFKTGAPVHGLVETDAMAAYAEKTKSWGSHIGLVTSGKGILKAAEFDRLLHDIRSLAAKGRVDASFGILTPDQARALKEAGVDTYNHNVETAQGFFSRIVTTHTYDDRVRTAKLVRENGMRLCCGGILGLGERPENRVDMAFEIRALDPDVIPINFLNPIPGTPLGDAPPLPPLDALKAVAMFRLVNPTKDIRICGGRDHCLGDLQSWIFLAGASGMMIGDYLTTRGREVSADLRMVKELGLVPVTDGRG